MSLRAAFLWSMIVSFAGVAALGIWAILFGVGRTGERVIITSLLVGAFSLTALACAILLDRRKTPAIAWCGIVASALALAAWLAFTWVNVWRLGNTYDWEELIAKAGTLFTCVAVWAPHVGLLLLLPLRLPASRVVRALTVATASTLAVFITLIVWTEEFEDWTGRTLGVLAILGACGTVITPLLAVVERVKGVGPGSMERRVEVELRCPRCGCEQRIRVGRARCAQCDLQMRLELKEPRCLCGYLLYNLTGDTCPECGRPVAPGSAWSDVAAADETT